MSIERVYYCEWRECEGHARTAASRPPKGFLTITEDGSSQHFCSWDCVLRFAGEKPPVEVIPVAS